MLKKKPKNLNLNIFRKLHISFLLWRQQISCINWQSVLCVLHQLTGLNLRFSFIGMAMATFTATLQCCHMDSLFAGVSICVSISAGLFCGIEGKPLHFHTKDRVALSLTFYISQQPDFNCYKPFGNWMYVFLLFLCLTKGWWSVHWFC